MKGKSSINYAECNAAESTESSGCEAVVANRAGSACDGPAAAGGRVERQLCWIWRQLAPEYVTRVPLATWFRYRAAAERTQASVVLLTQHACATSSGELQLKFHAGNARCDEATVFTGIEHCVEVVRRRFAQPQTHSQTNVVSLRKPPQNVNAATWRTRTTWAGPR